MGTPECLGDKLPDRWWRHSLEVIDHEAAAHGSLAAAARAHGLKPNTLVNARHGLGGRKLANGQKALLDDRPVADPERLREDQRDAESKHYRRENRELRDALANREAIIEQIVEAGRVPVRTPKYKVAKPTVTRPVRSAVLPIFDCQFGQLVQPSDTPMGVGEFNTRVFDERLQRWLEAVTGTMRDYSTSHRVDELVLVFGGDMVEGEDIFAGQAWQLEMDPARQTVEFKERWRKVLAEALIPFLKEEIGVKRILAVAVPGNHGKVGGKKKGAAPSTMSWDWLAIEWLKDSLRAEPIDVWGVEPGGALLFDTAGHRFLVIHGDEIKGWGGLPYYGITKFDGRMIRMSGEVYDYCLMGHHHQPASIPNGSGGEFIVSGDWVGGNNLSRFLASASRPQQRLLFIADKWGVTENIPLYLAETKRPDSRIYAAA